MGRSIMKRILGLGLLINPWTLQCASFLNPLLDKAQASLVQVLNNGYKKTSDIYDRAYAKMPSKEETEQKLSRSLQWVAQKIPTSAKTKVSRAYQVAQTKGTQGYCWVYDHTPSQEEITQRSGAALTLIKEKSLIAYQNIDRRIPVHVKQWVHEKKDAGISISQKLCVNVGVWLSKLSTFIG